MKVAIIEVEDCFSCPHQDEYCGCGLLDACDRAPRIALSGVLADCPLPDQEEPTQ